MIKKFSAIFLIYLLSFNISYAENIKNFIVEGNKRLSKETIEVIGQIEINSFYNQERINLLLKDLYSSNFFENIEININNNSLIIKLLKIL